MKEILLQKDLIDVSGTIKKIGTGADGALVVFVGRSRESSNYNDIRVAYLDYEVYEGMAEKELARIADEAYEQWPVNDCIIIHRFGKVEIGEAGIFIGISSAHRDDAYLASRYIIDTIKKRVPIWKTEVYSDGTKRVFDRS